MIKTTYGEFDGNKWEAVCQICFKHKYEKDSYQEIKASPGDYGIEGFTRKGDAFQCYCPDNEYTQDELHNKIRDKITTDLRKLDKYQKELKSKLNGTKIKRWIFVTPDYQKNQIIDHCAKKSQEYRLLKLDILDDDFDVLIYDADYYAEYIPVALNSIGEKLCIAPDKKTDEDIKAFEASGSTQAKNIINKAICIIDNASLGDKSASLAYTYISQYLSGYGILHNLQKKYGKSYEKYLRNISEMEEQLEQKRIFHESTNKDFIKNIFSEVSQRINSEFGELEQTTKNRLSCYVIASWLADCPLRFD
ncbi:MAG: hypothetical protein PHP00_10965 [Thiotrichaceae bacterium]|nr:hypothetical protein [Thiotrichaceae bacterium]